MHSTDQPTPALHTDTTDPLHDSPGRQLRVARETAEVTLEQVAAELHLSTNTIMALEDDHYDGLPSEVFVIGYLRAYGRLLGLDPAPLLDQYRRLRPSASHADQPVHSARETPGGSLALPAFVLPLALTAVVALALGGLGWLGWTKMGGGAVVAELFSQPEVEQDQDVSLSHQIARPVLPRPPADVASSTELEGDSQEQNAGSLALSAAERQIEPAGESAASVPEAGVQTDRDATALTSRQDANSERQNEGQASAQGSTRPPAVQENAGTGDQGSGEDGVRAEVVMTFSGPCWVDVRDASGEYKLFGEMNKGDRQVLGGRGPYSVILGNTAAVAVTVDGETFDLGTVARGNVARFDLDPAAL